MFLGKIREATEFGGSHAAVVELGLNLTLKANYCVCQLTGGFSMKGISQ